MKRLVPVAAACALLLSIVLLLTDPRKLPSLMLIVPFIFIFVVLFALLRLALGLSSATVPRQRRIAMLCAGLPVLLLVMQSIGQLTLRDIFASAALFVIAYFYISRMSQKAPR